jgi:hypothetical protein
MPRIGLVKKSIGDYLIFIFKAMLYDTKEKLNKRLDELQAPDIDRLMKKANKEGKGGRSAFALVKRYGIESDFDFSANEWGNDPKGI